MAPISSATVAPFELVAGSCQVSAVVVEEGGPQPRARRPRRGGRGRRARLPALAASTLVAIAFNTLAAQDERVTAAPHEIKAAFLVKFLGYTEWPPTSFERTDSPLRIVVLGDQDVAEALAEVARRQPEIGGRALEVSYHRLPNRPLRESDPQIEAARRAHAVYVGDDDPEHTARLLELIERDDVLTVGAQPEFCASGGMIALRERGRRIVFDANASAIRESSLKVSARVLQLARVVGPGSS